MARGRRSRKKQAGVGGTVFAVSIFFLLAGNWLAFVFLMVFAVSWWLGLEVRTTCDVETVRGTPCGNRAYGYLRACRRAPRHRQIKNAILFSYLGWKSPLRRIMWSDSASPARSVGSRSSASGSVVDKAPALAHGTRGAVNLTCAVVSASVAVIGLVFQVLAFAGPGG